MLRYQNGTWTADPGHTSHVHNDIDMVSTTDGWAVGWDGITQEEKIWHWDGSSWNEFQTVTGAIYCIDMIDATHGWIGGNGYFLRFNGTTWEYGGSAPNTVFGIQMKTDTDGWAVGYRFIMRRVGGSWIELPGANDWYLGDVSVFNNSEGWAAGRKISANKGLLVKYDGNSWQEDTILDNVTGLGQLSFVGRDWGWTSGSVAIILFCDGTKWTEVNSPVSNSLGVTFCLTREFGWLMGSNGTILKYKPNVSITPTSLGKIKAIYR